MRLQVVALTLLGSTDALRSSASMPHRRALAPGSQALRPSIALRASNDDGNRKLEVPEQPEYDVEGINLKELLKGDPTTLTLIAVWKSTSATGAPDNSSLSHFSAMTRPSWLVRAVRNRHRHAIEQTTRRWRGVRCDDSARTRLKILFSPQVGRLRAHRVQLFRLGGLRQRRAVGRLR